MKGLEGINLFPSYAVPILWFCQRFNVVYRNSRFLVLCNQLSVMMVKHLKPVNYSFTSLRIILRHKKQFFHPCSVKLLMNSAAQMRLYQGTFGGTQRTLHTCPRSIKASGFCELLRSRNILVAFESMKSWELSLRLVVQKMYTDLMKVMNELHDRNA